jgi:hypothetical protein
MTLIDLIGFIGTTIFLGAVAGTIIGRVLWHCGYRQF